MVTGLQLCCVKKRPPCAVSRACTSTMEKISAQQRDGHEGVHAEVPYQTTMPVKVASSPQKQSR